MNKHRFAMLALLVLMSVTLLTNIVYANAAEWPYVTIVVPNAPDDLEITLQFTDGSISEDDIHVKNSPRKGWETYFRWYVDMGEANMENAVIHVSSLEYDFECAVPTEHICDRSSILTLDLDKAMLIDGAYTGRYALIVSIRVLTTLIMEGVIFWLFSYREKRSWLCFLIINLITQAGVNIALYGAGIDSYAVLGFMLVEIFVFIAEMIAFPLALRENGKGRAVLYALAANAVSLTGGGILIAYLPV